VQIAKMLNDAGLRTGKNLRFTPRHVAGVRGIYKIFTPRTVAVQNGEISVKQAAQILGIPRRRDLQLAAPRAGSR
jgi:helix-turn-helix, Psq domain